MYLGIIYAWIAVAVSLLLLYIRQLYKRLSSRHVQHLSVLTILENEFWRLLGKQHKIESYMNVINAFPNDKVIGHADLMSSSIIVQDVDTITRVTTTGFEHFTDRQSISNDDEILLSRGLIMLKDDECKSMRSNVCPAFSESRNQLMLPSMIEVCEEMIKVLRNRIEESGNPYIDVEAKDLADRYSCDVLASCTFGLKINSQTINRPFYTMCKNVTNQDWKRELKTYLCRNHPNIAKMLNLSILRRETVEYFKDLVYNTLVRHDEDVTRHDFVTYLMENKEEWIHQDLEAQLMLPILTGFEPIATSISFLLYELAINPDEQDHLVQEIKEHSLMNDGKLDFQSLQSLPFLDMVVSEGLRLWPAVPFVDRVCVKNYNIGKPNNNATKDLLIGKGDVLIIPIYAIHRNPSNFPEPLKFDPERFSPDNRDNIKPFTYLPFGLGPRNCIGSHFALCAIKVFLYQLLREIEVYPFEKTCFPPQLPEHGCQLGLRGGNWIRFRIRTE